MGVDSVDSGQGHAGKNIIESRRQLLGGHESRDEIGEIVGCIARCPVVIDEAEEQLIRVVPLCGRPGRVIDAGAAGVINELGVDQAGEDQLVVIGVVEQIGQRSVGERDIVAREGAGVGDLLQRRAHPHDQTDHAFGGDQVEIERLGHVQQSDYLARWRQVGGIYWVVLILDAWRVGEMEIEAVVGVADRRHRLGRRSDQLFAEGAEIADDSDILRVIVKAWNDGDRQLEGDVGVRNGFGRKQGRRGSILEFTIGHAGVEGQRVGDFK